MKHLRTITLLFALWGCAGPPAQFASKPHQIKDDLDVTLSPLPDNMKAELSIQYLGVGGFVFETNNERLLTAPFFSNPPLHRNIPFRTIKSNPKIIEAEFPERLKDINNRVKAVLVGHSHYDHLMDLPYLMEHYLQDAKVYGSTTMTAILNNFDIACGVDDSATAISVNEKAMRKHWIKIPDSNIKILPILSSHAPHFLGITFQTGFYECGKAFALKTARDWRMGNVYAYLIDFMDNEQNIMFRVYYQDSASNPTGLDSGLIPADVIGKRDVDIAILVLAGSSKVKRYPQSRVENTRAELYIVGHWEDFFDRIGMEPVVVRGSDENLFIAGLERALHAQQRNGGTTQWVLPLPRETIVVKR